MIDGYRSVNPCCVVRALGGACHGVADFVVSSFHDIGTAAVYIGSGNIELSHQERNQILEAVEHSQAIQREAMDSAIMRMQSIDPSDHVFGAFRTSTRVGLEIGSLAISGYEIVRGVMAANRIMRGSAQAARLIRPIKKIEMIVDRGAYLSGSRRAQLEYAPYQKIRNESAIINGLYAQSCNVHFLQS